MSNHDGIHFTMQLVSLKKVKYWLHSLWSSTITISSSNLRMLIWIREFRNLSTISIFLSLVWETCNRLVFYQSRKLSFISSVRVLCLLALHRFRMWKLSLHLPDQIQPLILLSKSRFHFQWISFIVLTWLALFMIRYSKDGTSLKLVFSLSTSVNWSKCSSLKERKRQKLCLKFLKNLKKLSKIPIWLFLLMVELQLNCRVNQQCWIEIIHLRTRTSRFTLDIVMTRLNN